MTGFVIIGAGSRSDTYMKYVLENAGVGKVVAVAEPNDERRKNFCDKHGVPEHHRYKTWQDILVNLDHKIGDTAVIGTLDKLHYEPAINACRLGYDIILEKPMGISMEECRGIYEAVKKHGVKLYVCHVMRYHPLYRKAKELLDSGVLGKIKSVRWLQPVNIIHFVKSYLRHPEWSICAESGPLTLTKACHDLDLIYWLLGAYDADVLFATGDRDEFVPENQPTNAGGATLCTKCPIKDSCRYSALENYGTHKRYRHFVTDRPDPTREMAIEDLAGGPYDRCAWRTDADVMEEYEIIMRMHTSTGPVNANMSISAWHDDVCWRTATFIGTHGRLELNEAQQKLTLVCGTGADGSFGGTETFDCSDALPTGTKMTGHSGADYYFMKEIMDGQNLTPPEESLASHALAFDADQAREMGMEWKGGLVSRMLNDRSGDMRASACAQRGITKLIL